MVNPFNIHDNYGLLGYNHTQILNGGYVWTMPSPIKNNFLLKGIINGWQLSGTTSFQTGAPIQPNTNGNLYTNYGNTANGGFNVSPTTWLGSNAAGLVLVPLEVCDPGKNLHSGQYFNPSCFAPPAFGHNGTLEWGNLHGPAFFDSDLTLFKMFRIRESQSVEFRASGFNFLNRPNPQFGLGGNNDLTLNFANSNNVTQQTNQNAATTGTPAHTTGNRTIQFAVKYNF